MSAEWWNTEKDLRLICGSTADELLAWNGCETDGRTVHRITLGEECAWAQKSADKWHFVALAPLGEVFDADAVAVDKFFEKRCPPHWITKAKAIELDPDKNPPCAIGDWVVGRRPSGEFRLGKCAGTLNGKVTQVQFSDNQPAMTIDQTGAKTWFKMRGRDLGCSLLYARGKTLFHNYRLMCMQAANLEHKVEKAGAKIGATMSKSPRGFEGKIPDEMAALRTQIAELQALLGSKGIPVPPVIEQNASSPPGNAEEEVVTPDYQHRLDRVKLSRWRKVLEINDWKTQPIKMYGLEAFFREFDNWTDLGCDFPVAYAEADKARDAAEAELRATEHGAAWQKQIDDGGGCFLSPDVVFSKLGRRSI